MKKTATIILVVFFSIIIGCKTGVSEQEIVMTEGMEITATTSEGTIKILASKGFERIYTWDSCTRKVTHWPRKQRWYGSKGIYYPGPGFHWKDCNGVKRAVFEEGQQHFGSNDEAMKWIKKRRFMDYVYTNDGLMVEWHIEAHTLSCEVWQILINGKKPDKLEGSEDEKISISFFGTKDVDTYSKGIEAEDTYTSDEIKALEERIEKNPGDFEVRGILIEQYFLQAETSKDAREGWKRNIVWIVRNDRYLETEALPIPMLDPQQQKREIKLAIDLWNEIVDVHKDDPLVLSAAARFLMFYEDMGTAERLLKRAKELEPKNPDWMEKLAMIYELRAERESGKAKEVLLKKALEERKKAKELIESDIFYLLCDLTKISFNAGEMKKADQYARQLLKEADTRKNDWNYGNAIHDGNMVLGRIALKSGDIEKAKYYLIEAGKTPGSPQLNSFGPNMTLAKELLEKGEKEIVLEYLELCRNFWEIDVGKLDKWTEQVKKGKIPDFGRNLVY